MRDFSYSIFSLLIQELKNSNYKFIQFGSYPSKNLQQIILRHDIDRNPGNALKIAEIESSLGICGSYYFRIIPETFNKKIIEKIASLGHEIGYHYEDLALAKGDKEKAIKMFEENLKKFREIYPVKTICMHGSPLSKYDNRTIWQHYNYKYFGIIGEPYFDIDWNEFAYLTDTGRRWNGRSVSLRDKVNGKHDLNFKSTWDIISNTSSLPQKIMLTIHPERWNDNLFNWSRQLIMQYGKNLVKRFLVKD